MEEKKFSKLFNALQITTAFPSVDEINKEWKRALIKYHPDKSDGETTEQVRTVKPISNRKYVKKK